MTGPIAVRQNGRKLSMSGLAVLHSLRIAKSNPAARNFFTVLCFSELDELRNDF